MILRGMDLSLGSAAPRFSLPGVDGRAWSLDDFREPALVLVVTCNHCPVAIAYEDRLIALAKEFAGRAAIVAINPNDATSHPEDSFDAMKRRSEEKAFPFPYLRDESQAIARALDARCTPDPFVFDASRKLVYMGRIDDSHRDPSKVTRRDLALAIEATLAGRAIDFDVRPAVGCSIKWKG
jgi:peroxiredoxin